jgi:hemoglobin-like flavoprotein
MNPKQVALVQRSWNDVLPIAETAAQMFYERLFDLDPSLRPLFQSDMTKQRHKLVDMLSVVVSGLTRLEELLPTVRALGRRHAGYGVRNEHYATVGMALLWTLDQGLGDAFTPEVREAWAAVYGLVATTMKDAARETLTAA